MRSARLIALLMGGVALIHWSTSNAAPASPSETRSRAAAAHAVQRLAQAQREAREEHKHDEHDAGRSDQKEGKEHQHDEGHKDHDEHKHDDPVKHAEEKHDHDHGTPEKDEHAHEDPAKHAGDEYDHDHRKAEKDDGDSRGRKEDQHDKGHEEQDEHAHEDPAKHAEEKHDHDHGGTPEKDEHGHEEHRDVVHLTAEQQREFNISLESAQRGAIASTLLRPAEIQFNQDRVAHVVPRVAGVVRDVMVSEGEKVEAGAIMAVLDSRELADAKAAYLAAWERMQLAQETFNREQNLWKQKISSEKEYLDAKTTLAERRIALRAASQKLRALGLNKAFLEKLVENDDAELTAYNLVAPFSGTAISRHITRGEAVTTESEAFVLADVRALWADVTIYPKDFAVVREGQRVRIILDDGHEPFEGLINFVTPHVSEETRTAIARITLENSGGRLRPGMFVRAKIEIGAETAAIRIPRSAIQRFENKPVVFVGKEGEFSPRPVTVGRENGEFAEILAGLEPGETYVSKGAFVLKAQLSKASFDDGHNH